MSPTNFGVLLVLLGATFAGLRPLFGRWLTDEGITTILITLYNSAASMAIFLPYSLREIQRYPLRQRQALIGFLCGLFIGVGSLAYFEALRYLPVATVTLIYFTYPAMVIAVIAVLRCAWPVQQSVMAVGCVIVGCLLIIDPRLSVRDDFYIGVAIAFVSPLAWTLLLILLAGPLTVLSPLSRIGFIATGASCAMLISLWIWPPIVFLPHTELGWLGVAGLILVSGIGVQILFTLGVARVGAERASIAGVFEVATSLAVGWLIFLEPTSLWQGIGVVLIGLALYLTRNLELST